MSESLREQLTQAIDGHTGWCERQAAEQTEECWACRDNDDVMARIWPLVVAYGDSRAAEGRQQGCEDAALAIERDMGGWDPLAGQKGIGAHCARLARGPSWSSEVVRVARQNIDNAQKRTGR